MNFDIPFMISQKNFEIRSVLYENGLVRNHNYRKVFAAQDSVHGVVTSLQNGIFSFP